MKDNKVWELQSFCTESHSRDPYSAGGQAEILVRKALIELLPVVLADLGGFFEVDDGMLVNGNNDDGDMGFTVSDLARRSSQRWIRASLRDESGRQHGRLPSRNSTHARVGREQGLRSLLLRRLTFPHDDLR